MTVDGTTMLPLTSPNPHPSYLVETASKEAPYSRYAKSLHIFIVYKEVLVYYG